MNIRKIADLFQQNAALGKSQEASKKSSISEEGKKTALGTGSELGDRVSISPEARQFMGISKVISEDEQARRAKVDDLKARIERGEYNVSSKKIAESIVAFGSSEV